MGWSRGGAEPRVATIEYDTITAFSDLNDYGVQISYIHSLCVSAYVCTVQTLQITCGV
jgi:hypothetical protein